MATAPHQIGMRFRSVGRAEKVIMGASLGIALLFGLVIGRTTAPASATSTGSTVSVLGTAGLGSANGERHLQVMRKMNRLDPAMKMLANH